MYTVLVYVYENQLQLLWEKFLTNFRTCARKNLQLRSLRILSCIKTRIPTADCGQLL
jgi:hypothetical protein